MRDDFFQSMFNRLLSLFLKPNCPLCQRTADDVFCQYCLDKISSCELQHNHEKLIQPDFLLFSWGKYDRDLKRAIALLKYEQKPEIGEILGRWLGEIWLKSGNQQKYPHLIVIPVPSHRDKIKTRGYNQAELIALSFCRITRYPLKNNILIREKNTQAMFGLTPSQRQENIKKAFRISEGYRQIKPSQKILIVDDIYTTGTTINEVKKVLEKTNLKTIGVATVSRVNI